MGLTIAVANQGVSVSLSRLRAPRRDELCDAAQQFAHPEIIQRATEIDRRQMTCAGPGMVKPRIRAGRRRRSLSLGSGSTIPRGARSGCIRASADRPAARNPSAEAVGTHFVTPTPPPVPSRNSSWACCSRAGSVSRSSKGRGDRLGADELHVGAGQIHHCVVGQTDPGFGDPPHRGAAAGHLGDLPGLAFEDGVDLLLNAEGGQAPGVLDLAGARRHCPRWRRRRPARTRSGSRYRCAGTSPPWCIWSSCTSDRARRSSRGSARPRARCGSSGSGFWNGISSRKSRRNVVEPTI